jgi:hypothetical protein
MYAVGVVALLAVAACAGPTAADKAHADAVAQAETSRRHLEALVPYDLAPLSPDLARRALVRDGVLLSSTGTNAEATVEARFTGVGWSESFEPTRTDLAVCFRMTRHGGTHDFDVTELDTCP